MNILSNNLSENFNSPAGTIGVNGYVTFSGSTPITIASDYETHYDLRSFNANSYSTRITMADLMYQSVGYWGGSGTAGNFTVEEMQVNYPNANLNPSIENWKLSTSGVGDVFLSETPVTISIPGGKTVTSSLGPDALYRRSSALSMTFNGTNPSGTFYSSYDDDIYTNFNTPGTDYLISMVIRDAPTQTSALTFNLNKSFLDITSDTTGSYSATKTDSIPFSQFSTLSGTATQDTYIEFNRNQLVNCDISKITGVRFRVVTTGTGTLTTKFQNMKVYPSGTYTFPFIEINTKIKRYQGSVGISGTIINNTMDPVFFYPARPKNLIQAVKFNTGSRPPYIYKVNTALQAATSISGSYYSSGIIVDPSVGSLGTVPFAMEPLASFSGSVVESTHFSAGFKNSPAAKSTSGSITLTHAGVNSLDLYYRHIITSGTSNIFVPSNVGITLAASGTNTRLDLFQTASGIKNIIGTLNTVSLSGTTDYVLRTTLNESTIKAEILEVNGSFYSRIISSIGPITLSGIPSRGYVGWDHKPYSYDFNINEIGVKRAEFGTFISKPFQSNKPVNAAQLNALTSPPLTLLSNNDFVAIGDSTLSGSVNTGSPPPDILVTRTGTPDWIGGIISSEPIDIGDTDELYISGSIYPYSFDNLSTTTYSGTYRVTFLSEEGYVAYIYNIPSIIGNQWNNFTIPVKADLVAGRYYISFQNVGYAPTLFEIDNVKISHNTISWSASNDGSSFQPFYDNVNNEYSALHFKQANTMLQVKASALSDTDNWVENYTLIPIYK